MSQHRPSTHPPAVAHSRQPLTLQSAAGSQDPADPSSGVQRPVELQKLPVEQSASDEQPLVHAPVLHTPAHVTTEGSWHVPDAQLPPGCKVKTPVQIALLQDVASGLEGLEQAPEPVLHVPGSWQASGAGHTTGAPDTHVPEEQASFCVQALPSLHDDALGTLKHAPTWDGTLQAMQSVAEPLPQGVSQQTPSMQ